MELIIDPAMATAEAEAVEDTLAHHRLFLKAAQNILLLLEMVVLLAQVHPLPQMAMRVELQQRLTCLHLVDLVEEITHMLLAVLEVPAAEADIAVMILLEDMEAMVDLTEETEDLPIIPVLPVAQVDLDKERQPELLETQRASYTLAEAVVGAKGKLELVDLVVEETALTMRRTPFIPHPLQVLLHMVAAAVEELLL